MNKGTRRQQYAQADCPRKADMTLPPVTPHLIAHNGMSRLSNIRGILRMFAEMSRIPCHIRQSNGSRTEDSACASIVSRGVSTASMKFEERSISRKRKTKSMHAEYQPKLPNARAFLRGNRQTSSIVTNNRMQRKRVAIDTGATHIMARYMANPNSSHRRPSGTPSPSQPSGLNSSMPQGRRGADYPPHRLLSNQADDPRTATDWSMTHSPTPR